MKKTFIALLAIASVAACNKAEVISVTEGEVIGFGEAFVDNSTKTAADPSYVVNTKDISLVDVWGTVNGGEGAVLIFNGADVTKSAAAYGSAWNCDVTQYWVAGADYNFVGIVDGEKEGVTSINFDHGMPVSINYVADGATDLLCDTEARENALASGNDIVKFDFTHLLAKAKFVVENTTPTAANYQHSITNIKITNAYAVGTYKVGTGWDVNTLTTTKASGQSDDYNSFGDIPYTDTDMECAAEKLLIPGLTNVTVEFTSSLYYVVDGNATLINTTEYTGVNAKTATITIEPAKSYQFKIQVGVGQPISFTASALPAWEPVTPATNI